MGTHEGIGGEEVEVTGCFFCYLGYYVLNLSNPKTLDYEKYYENFDLLFHGMVWYGMVVHSHKHRQRIRL